MGVYIGLYLFIGFITFVITIRYTSSDDDEITAWDCLFISILWWGVWSVVVLYLLAEWMKFLNKCTNKFAKFCRRGKGK